MQADSLTVSKLAIKTRHSLFLAVRNHEQLQRFAFIDISPVNPVESPPFKLNDIMLLQSLQPGISNNFSVCLSVGVDVVLEVIFLLELFLGNKVVKLR